MTAILVDTDPGQDDAVALLLAFAHADRLESATEVWGAVEAAERTLGSDGRVLVRASGTEPLVRVMVEAVDEATARRTANSLAAIVARALA